MRSRGLVVAIAVVLAVLAAVGVIVYTSIVKESVKSEDFVDVLVLEHHDDDVVGRGRPGTADGATGARPGRRRTALRRRRSARDLDAAARRCEHDDDRQHPPVHQSRTAPMAHSRIPHPQNVATRARRRLQAANPIRPVHWLGRA